MDYNQQIIRSIIFGLFIHEFVNGLPAEQIVKDDYKTANFIHSKLSAPIIDLLFNTKTTTKRDIEATTVRPVILKNPDIVNGKPVKVYTMYPAYPQVPQSPSIYPSPGIGNSISTSQSGSNSQTITYANGMVSSASSSHSSSVSQGVAQSGGIPSIGSISPIAPISPVVPVSPVGPFFPVSSAGQMIPVGIGSRPISSVFPVSPMMPIIPSTHTQSQTSIGTNYGTSRSQSIATNPVGYGPIGNQAETIATTGFGQRGPIAVANGKAQPGSTAEPFSFLRFKRNVENLETLKSMNSKNGASNFIRLQQKRENDPEARTFDMIIDAINGFLNPTPPPCPQPPCTPSLPPPSPPVVSPSIPVIPCQPYPYCPTSPCYPICQHIPEIPYSPIMPNKVSKNPIPIPKCDTHKIEKTIKQDEQQHRNQNDDSGEEVTNVSPCYQTGTSPLQIDNSLPSSMPSTMNNNLFVQSVYPPIRYVHPLIGIYPDTNAYTVMNNVYPMYPYPFPNGYPVYSPNFGYYGSRSVSNNGPFTSSSSSSLSTTQIGPDGKRYGYFDSHTKSGSVEQRSTGVIGFLGSDITIIKRLSNGSREIERLN